MKVLSVILSITLTTILANSKDNPHSKFHLPGEMHPENFSQMMHDDPVSDPSQSFFNDHFENGERPMLDQFIDHGQQNNLMTMGRDMVWINTSTIREIWDGSTWENSVLYSYTYDATDNQTEYLYQTWDGSAWVNSYLYSYTYDANNNQTENLSQTWDGSDWVKNYLLLTSKYLNTDYVNFSKIMQQD